MQSKGTYAPFYKFSEQHSGFSLLVYTAKDPQNEMQSSTAIVEAVGTYLFGIYHVVIIIVLINMLIAMMSHSFEDIQKIFLKMKQQPNIKRSRVYLCMSYDNYKDGWILIKRKCKLMLQMNVSILLNIWQSQCGN
jgi:hypothetical protein